MTSRSSTHDVILIGGGVAGASAALALAQAGKSVALVEQRLVGGMASGVNFGGVRQQGRNYAELPLARRALEIWRRQKTFLDDDAEYETPGHLKVARSDADMRSLIAYAEGARAYGLPLTIIDGLDLHRMHPWLGANVVGGSLCAEDGHANPRLLAPAYGRAARAAGADILEWHPVTHTEKTGDLFQVLAHPAHGGDEVRLTAPTLVNCAGFHGGKIAACFGEPIPIRALRPSMLVSAPLPYTVTRVLGVCGGDTYIRQIRRGNMIFGGGEGFGHRGGGFARTTPTALAACLRASIGVVPLIARAAIIRTWSGIDGETGDRLPVLGFSQTTENLIHAFGFSGHGFQIGPAVGAVIADLCLTGRTETPIQPFDIRRFHGASVPAVKTPGWRTFDPQLYGAA